MSDLKLWSKTKLATGIVKILQFLTEKQLYNNIIWRLGPLCSTVILTGLFSQCEENTNLQDSGRYLKLPFSKGIFLGNNSQAVKTTKESFWITSFLCSTKLTQNGRICWLLKTWWVQMGAIAGLFHAIQARMYSKIAYVLSILHTGFLHIFLYPDGNQCSMINHWFQECFLD